jgi:hypothetical protein
MRKLKPARSRTKQAAPKTRPRKVAPLPHLAFSIAEFCKAFGISPALYWKIKAQGLGPREMRIGRRVLISPQAASAWGRRRERATAAA